jgi:protein-L-isoaspartate(D-aspartate) O-methyltransferase
MVAVVIVTGLPLLHPCPLRAQDFEAQRLRMVSQTIEARGVNDVRVLEAMRSVERHRFVEGALAGEAYRDRPLPIGHGQTISQPYIVAFMTEVVRPKSDMRVLEIGTGSGYQAAVLAEIVDSVFTIEIVEPLASSAKARLDSLDYDNVVSKHDDGYWGWEDKAPFDAVVVTAAAEHVPPPLIEQLKDGGRIIIPLGSPFFTQNLVLVIKRGDDITTRNLLPVRFVPFTRDASR